MQSFNKIFNISIAGAMFSYFITERLTPRRRSANGRTWKRRSFSVQVPGGGDQEKARRRRQLAEGKICNQPWPC